MNIFQLSASVILVVFYVSYFTKMLLQKQKGIKTNQMAKGTKLQRTILVETALKITSLVIVLVEVISIILDDAVRIGFESIAFRTVGLVLAAMGVLIFIIAMVTMRDSWRAGISKEEKTRMITTGIYRFSRNPAFVGFDLMYIGLALTFGNIVLMCVTFVTVVTFHLQILEEEKFLSTVFREQYDEYQKKVRRYI